MYIMKMKPEFQDYLWGGERLVELFGKDTALRPVAESWEISCYPDCASTIDNGGFKGRKLSEILREHPEFAGKNAGEFPVLIKLIDAKQSLSLQVHPGDEYARRVENQAGKNEMWYVVDCNADSELIIGFKNKMGKDEITQSIRDNTILEHVNSVKVRPGDCFSIPAGLLHAIGAGCLIAEIQQSSNVTYRVYDYNRTGADGKPRELHIEKAVDVIDSEIKAVNNSGNKPEAFDGYTRMSLTDWKYFDACLLNIETHASLNQNNEGFSCILVTEGALEARCGGESLPLKAGDSAFIPAGLGAYTLKGRSKVLLAEV